MSLLWDRPTGAAFDAMLDDMAATGYDGLACFATDLVPFFTDPARLGEALAARGLELAGVTALVDDDEAWLLEVAECMAALGCTNLACTDFDTGLSLERAAKILNSRGLALQQFGITVCYHNHTGGVAQTAEEMDALSALCHETVGTMLDVGHATKDFSDPDVGARAANFLARRLPQVDYLEFKDHNEVTDLNTPLGEGRTDFGRIVGLLRRAGYSGWVTVEQNGNDGPSLGRGPRECAALSRDFLLNRYDL